jgi:hypothetical protein
VDLLLDKEFNSLVATARLGRLAKTRQQEQQMDPIARCNYAVAMLIGDINHQSRLLNDLRQPRRTRVYKNAKQHLENVWNAIGSVLTIQIEDQDNPLYRKAVGRLRFCILSQTLRSLDEGCRMVKEVALWALRRLAVDRPVEVDGHPALPHRGKFASLKELIGLDIKGIREKTFLGSLATADRALPNGTWGLAVKKVQNFLDDITQPKKVERKVITAVKAITKRFAGRLGNIPKDTHFSLGASSCYEFTREDGGKATYIQKQIAKFANLPVQTDWQSFVDFRDRPVFTVELKEGDLLWQVAFRPSRADGVFTAPKMDPDGVMTYDGIDQFIGPLILLWALSECIQKGWLVPNVPIEDTYLALWRQESLKRLELEPGIPYPTRVTYICEPGYRIRVINIPPAAASVLGQFCRHQFEHVLWRDPRAVPGDSLYYVVEGFKSHQRIPEKKIPLDQIWVKSTDFKGASNKLALNYARALISGFLDGCKWPKASSLRRLEKFLTAPRKIVVDTYKDRKGRELSFNLPHGLVHNCGTLLGDPFSFMVLSVNTLFIYEAASMYTHSPYDFPNGITNLLRLPTLAHFYGQILGDDSIVFTVLKFLEKYNHISNQVLMEISMDKDIESQYVATYAEQYAFRLTVSEEFMYHDTIKARYFSPYAKSTGIQTDARTPALLKAGPLTRVLRYYDDPINESIRYQKGRTVSYYYHCFPSMLKLELQDFPVALPQVCGGCSAPIEDEEAFLLKYEQILGRLMTILELPAHEFISWFFRLSYLSHGSQKGLIRPLSDTIEYQIACDPQVMTGVGILSTDEVRIRLTQMGQPPRQRGIYLDYKDLERKAKEHINVYNLLTLLKSLERSAEFAAALSGNLDPARRPVVSVTLRNYANNWNRLKPALSEVLVHKAPFQGGLGGIERSFLYRLNGLYIESTHPLVKKVLSESPSLVMDC